MKAKPPKPSNQSKRGSQPQQGISIKASPLAYAILRKLAENDRRSLTAQLDVILLAVRDTAKERGAA